MPKDKRYRKPKCGCGTTLNPTTGRCPHGCESFKKPHARVRSFERGRKEEGYGMPSYKEVDRGFRASGLGDQTATIPLIMVNRKAS